MQEVDAFLRSHGVCDLGGEADQVLGVVALESHDLLPDVLQRVQVVGLDVPSDDAPVVVEGGLGLSLLVVVVGELVEDLRLLDVDLDQALPDLDLALGHVVDGVALCQDLQDVGALVEGEDAVAEEDDLVPLRFLVVLLENGEYVSVVHGVAARDCGEIPYGYGVALLVLEALLAVVLELLAVLGFGESGDGGVKRLEILHLHVRSGRGLP